uniref:LURP-one-related/scramblase family protein n=1 Tax=uncultured Dysgonomonas sp. TaxID=206096 RepID=UPI0026172C84|nr:phospholipid scramblase-related protein [uncultured Dysgonomonas sp.]
MDNFPKFFETNEYFIDQKVNYFKFEAEYKVFGQDGNQIGVIKQRISTGHKILRLFLGKAMMPFLLEIVDTEGNTLAVIKRGWTFFMSEIVILNGHHEILGFIKQKWAFLKPTFHIMAANKTKIAEIKGDWKGWNFAISEANGQPIGTISKKWAGAMKEIFTTADKYNVSIREEYKENTDKIVVVSTAITIDMVLKESK